MNFTIENPFTIRIGILSYPMNNHQTLPYLREGRGGGEGGRGGGEGRRGGGEGIQKKKH